MPSWRLIRCTRPSAHDRQARSQCAARRQKQRCNVQPSVRILHCWPLSTLIVLLSGLASSSIISLGLVLEKHKTEGKIDEFSEMREQRGVQTELAQKHLAAHRVGEVELEATRRMSREQTRKIHELKASTLVFEALMSDRERSVANLTNELTPTLTHHNVAQERVDTETSALLRQIAGAARAYDALEQELEARHTSRKHEDDEQNTLYRAADSDLEQLRAAQNFLAQKEQQSDEDVRTSKADAIVLRQEVVSLRHALAQAQHQTERQNADLEQTKMAEKATQHTLVESMKEVLEVKRMVCDVRCVMLGV